MQSRKYCVASMRLKFKPSSSFISNDHSVFGFPITNFRIFHQRDFSIVLATNGSWHDFSVPVTANNDGRFRIILYMDFINRISFTTLKCVEPLYFFHLLFSLFSLSVLSVLKRTSNIYRIRSSVVLYFWNFWPFVVYKSIIRFAIFLLIRCPFAFRVFIDWCLLNDDAWKSDAIGQKICSHCDYELFNLTIAHNSFIGRETCRMDISFGMEIHGA